MDVIDMRPRRNLLRVEKVLAAMEQIGQPLLPDRTGHTYRTEEGNTVQIRTAKLTAISKVAGSRRYSYEVWHVNLERLGRGVSRLLIGLFNATGTRLQAIKEIRVKRGPRPKHTAITKRRLADNDGLIYKREGIL